MLYLKEQIQRKIESVNSFSVNFNCHAHRTQTLTSSLVVFDFDVLSGIQSFPYDFHHQRFVQVDKLTGHDDLVKIFFFYNEAEAIFFDQFQTGNKKIRVCSCDCCHGCVFGLPHFVSIEQCIENVLFRDLKLQVLDAHLFQSRYQILHGQLVDVHHKNDDAIAMLSANCKNSGED